MIDFSSPRHRAKFGYLILAPAVLLMAALIVYPIVLSVDISFQDVRIAKLGQSEPWTLANYRWLMSSPELWRALRVTVCLAAVVCVVALLIGLGTALLLNQRFPGRAIARVLVAIPWAVPEVVATVIWAWMLDSSFGVVNWALIRAHIIARPIEFASDPGSAFFAVAAVMVWKGYPLISIMLLAGLQSIPEEYYQAAAVDGASAWRRFVHVTLPGLMPVIIVTLVVTTLWVFRDFAIIQILTKGGPIGSTTTLSILTWEQSFSFFRMGQGAAVGVVTMVICALVSRFLVGRFARTIH